MTKKKITVRRAIITGQLIVNLPVALIITGSGFTFSFFALSFRTGLIVGCLFAWIYWSFTIPRWRNWALKNGANPGELQKWGQWTFLTWKKGSFFEKTEFEQDKK